MIGMVGAPGTVGPGKDDPPGFRPATHDRQDDTMRDDAAHPSQYERPGYVPPERGDAHVMQAADDIDARLALAESALAHLAEYLEPVLGPALDPEPPTVRLDGFGTSPTTDASPARSPLADRLDRVAYQITRHVGRIADLTRRLEV